MSHQSAQHTWHEATNYSSPRRLAAHLTRGHKLHLPISLTALHNASQIPTMHHCSHNASQNTTWSHRLQLLTTPLSSPQHLTAPYNVSQLPHNASHLPTTPHISPQHITAPPQRLIAPHNTSHLSHNSSQQALNQRRNNSFSTGSTTTSSYYIGLSSGRF